MGPAISPAASLLDMTWRWRALAVEQTACLILHFETLRK
jgi:hypothetical protein